MKTVLVTGAGGYIGSVLVPKLLAKGYRVKALDRFFFGEDTLQEHPHLIRIKEDSRRLREALFAQVDHVIDLVAISNDPSGEMLGDITWQINHISRVRTANMAKQMGVKSYILPSSCSVYGFQDDSVDETAPLNPLTTYAQANARAEEGVLALADTDYCVTVMRQATVFGVSPRMRFDLAINGMTYGAWHAHELPLMRDGSQYRPMVHIQDTTDVMCQLLEMPPEKINGAIFNVGGEANNYQLAHLGDVIAQAVARRTGKAVQIAWYGDPDHRSYRVDFTKIKTVLGWEPKWDAVQGAEEITEQLENGTLVKTTQSNTLGWYTELIRWHRIIKACERYGGILEI